jgi:DNA replication and repair protein RecF
MVISSLEIANFRNLRQVALQCSPRLNLIVGANASGKTSLLEALYFLGRARSFRTHQVRELIHHGEAAFRIVAMIAQEASGPWIPVGIERSLRKITARIGGEPARSLAELAVQVPILLLNPSSHKLLEEGPQYRRRFMDWGLFHTDQGFLKAWKRYGTALRHRNAALRANATNRSIDAWDEELLLSAAVLDRLRQDFCAALEESLMPLVSALLGKKTLSIEYRRGWRQGESLVDLLHRGRDQDRRYGYTCLGPQRADFIVRLDGRMAPEYLSRGQQKLLVIALVLAQTHFYQTHQGSPCILLIDDLPAELDRSHRELIIDCLAGISAQLFVTAIEIEPLNLMAGQGESVFEIDHGSISDITSRAD